MHDKMENSLGLHSVNSKIKVVFFEFTVSNNSVHSLSPSDYSSLPRWPKSPRFVFELPIQCLLATCEKAQLENSNSRVWITHYFSEHLFSCLQNGNDNVILLCKD